MNEELQNALTRIINETIEATGDATAFVLSQAPDVIQQLLTYQAFKSIAFCATFGIFVVVYWAFYFKPLMALSAKDPNKGHDEECRPALVAVSVVTTILYLLLATVKSDWLQIWLAPKIYLIEYAARMVN